MTSGIYRGRLLKTPAGIRPTQDRVRKSLFDVLGTGVVRRRVLDLFAGSGALGLEALSRGADSALFVDSAGPAVQAIVANMEALGLLKEDPGHRAAREILGGRAEVWKMDHRAAIRRMTAEGRRFDLILLDPPYRSGMLAEVLQSLVETDVLPEHGLVVAEAESRLEVPSQEGLESIDERRYGGTRLFYLMRRPI